MVLVAGESLMDLIPISENQDESLRFEACPGGSPYNVALALGRFGLQPWFLGRFAEDALGQRLKRHLIASGVRLDWCPRHPGYTTLGFVTGDTTPSYAFYTGSTAGVALTPDELPASLPDELTALHFGSFALAVEPIATALETLLHREKTDRLISVDPNIRPFLIARPADYLPRLQRFIESADLIKLSRDDLEWLHPGMKAEAYAAKLTAEGASMVVVTLGGDGAYVQRGALKFRYPAVPVKVVDTVGAGDVFQAALLFGLKARNRLQKDDLAKTTEKELGEVMSFALRAAAENCTKRGCDPPCRQTFAGDGADSLRSHEKP